MTEKGWKAVWDPGTRQRTGAIKGPSIPLGATGLAALAAATWTVLGTVRADSPLQPNAVNVEM
jgi:hypothetical protein